MAIEGSTGYTRTTARTVSAPTYPTRRKEEEEPAPTRIQSPTTAPIVTLTSDTTVTPPPTYSPPPDGGSSGGGGTSGGGGGGTGTTASPVPTTTIPTSNSATSSGVDFKSLFEALLPYMSPEDRQRLISTAAIQGINIGPVSPAYTSLVGAPYKVDPANLEPDGFRKGIELKGTIDYFTGIMGKDEGLNKVRELLDKGIYYIKDPENVSLIEGDPSISEQSTSLSIIPSELKGTTREYFAGSQRAESVAQALENFAAAQGKTSDELGSGYRFLTEIASNLRRFSPEAGPMSRKQYVEFLGQINPLLEQAPSSTYQELGRMLSLPFFSAGNLYNVSRSQDGTYRFGDANKRLFR